MATAAGGDGRQIVADREGVIRHWGSEVEGVFGYTPEEALGRKVDLIIPPVLHARHWRGFEKAIATGRMKRPDPTLKLPGLHKDGAIIAFHGTLALTRDDEGAADGAMATVFGRGPAWQAAAWRAVLAPFALGHALRGRWRWRRRQ